MNAFEKFIQDLYGAVIRENRWHLYLEGLKNTLLIAVTACLIGIFIGLIVSTIKYVAATKESRLWKAAAALCSAYTTVIRG
ncbi:MAG: amino acid ABC transporter permease, partial [Clostridia bacterium]|nr:amino acid ABC transporter permease [Clostridia bacterium]